MLVAINRHVRNKLETREEFSAANGTYENADLSLTELADEVRAGHAFCARHKDGWRNKKNFTGAGFLAVDVDHGLRMEIAMAHPFVQQFAGFLYTTPSHTDEEHRFRIVFELDEHITDRLRMELAFTGLMFKFGGDKSCVDACRQFFGNTGALITMIGRRLPVTEVDTLVLRGTELRNAKDSKERSGSSRDTIRSEILLPADVMVTDRSGAVHRLVDLPAYTPIHCPQHVDDRPSAFTLRSRKGTPGVHCSACASTYFIKHEGPYYDFDYGLRVLRDKSLEEWELEQSDDPHFEPEVKRKAAGVHIVTEKFLQPIDTDASVIFVKSPKGSGKTEWLTKIVADAKHDKQSVLLIGHRRSLILSTAKRLGLTPYIQMVEDPDNGRSTVAPVPASRYYAVCADSLDVRLEPARNQYDIVIIDEVEQVMAHLTASTLRENRRAVLAHLSHYLKRSKKLYALDADLHRVAVNCIGPLIGDRESCLFLFNDQVEKRGALNFYSSKDQLAQVLHDDLEEGKRCFVCSNSKELVDRLVLTLQDGFADRKKFKLITSENSQSADVQHFLLNLPNSMLDYDCVLVSPAVGTGVDITFPNSEAKIDAVYGFFQARITTHFDIDQQLCRVRHPGAVHVWISPQTFSFETDTTVLRREVREATRREIGALGFDDHGNPQYHPIDDLYAEIYAEVKSLQRASKNNLRENFRELRTYYGWNVIDIPPSNGVKEAGAALMKRGEELQRERFIIQVCAAPPISSEEYTELRARQDKGTMLEPELAAMRRYELEHFYLCPVSPELLVLDKKGRYRQAVKLFDLVTGTEEDAARSAYRAKSDLSVDRNESVDRRRLLVNAFTAAGVFSDGKGFDRTIVITHEGLAEFVRVVRGMSTSIQRLLDRTPRQDIEQKPAQQLGDFLRLVGLSLKKVRQKRSGDLKIYSYQINDTELAAVEAIVTNRRNHSAGPTTADDREDVAIRSRQLQEAIEQVAAEFRSKAKSSKSEKHVIDILLGDGNEPATPALDRHGEAEAAASA